MHLHEIDLRSQPGINILLDFKNQNEHSNQWTSIIGASGAGKSTILNRIFEQTSSQIPIFLYNTHRKCTSKNDTKAVSASTPDRQSISLAKRILVGTGVTPTEVTDIGIAEAEISISLSRGTSSKWISIDSLPSSYLSVIEWVVDLTKRLCHLNQKASPSTLEGIVLLDDVDAHLDPQWQAALPMALKKALPNIQFITTAKSAAIVSALSPSEIIRIGYNPKTECIERMKPNENGDGWICISKSKQQDLHHGDPRTMTATEIYQSYFDIKRLTLNEHGELLRSHSALSSMPNRNAYQDEKLLQLRAKIEKI